MRNEKQTETPPQPDSLYKTYIFPPQLKKRKEKKVQDYFPQESTKKIENPLPSLCRTISKRFHEGREINSDNQSCTRGT